MNTWNAIGFVASGLVVAAFCMRDIIALRAIALTSNIAFLLYGIGLGLAPVWLLRATLLPVNCWRLLQGVSHRGTPPPGAGMANALFGPARRPIPQQVEPTADRHENGPGPGTGG